MPNSSEISDAARLLRRGGLVAFPTETVYGLGADATSDAAVARIFAAKSRPQFNPLISHVASVDAAMALGEFPKPAERLARQFWPGPLTLVVKRRQDCPVSLLASAGLESIALRVPRHDMALALLAAVEIPIAAPSANRSGRISPTTAGHVRQSLGADVDLVLDGGPCAVGVESTVVQFLEGKANLLRPGGLAREVLEQAMGSRFDDLDGGGPLHGPGQLESHYAPRAGLRLNAVSPLYGETYVGFGTFGDGGFSLSPAGDLREAAANLFRILHEVDALGSAMIAVAPIPDTGLGEAINDRLRRAAAPRQQ
jgi:L-threonylcarbamoyladenylate synthase